MLIVLDAAVLIVSVRCLAGGQKMPLVGKGMAGWGVGARAVLALYQGLFEVGCCGVV